MDQLIQLWLHELCKNIKGVSKAVVFIYTQEGSGLTPVACRPERMIETSSFLTHGKLALSSGECVCLQNKEKIAESGEPLDVVACPLFEDKRARGVVVVQMMTRTALKQKLVTQKIHDALPWLRALVRYGALDDKRQLIDIVELVASSFEHDRFEAAATEVVTDIASRLLCDRVSLGFVDGQVVSIEAISHSSSFDRRSNLVRGFGESMFEAIDQRSSVLYPEKNSDLLVTRCHKTLYEDHKIGNILTVPFVVGEKIAGALLAERPSDRPFDPGTQERLENMVSMIGPVLNVRYRDEQWLPGRMSRSVKCFVSTLLGPGYLRLKLSSLAFVCCFLLISLVSKEYSVTGDAKLEARTQQVVVAPLDGYIAQASFRPGDLVVAGESLGALEDKDLQLEYLKWSSRLDQFEREYRDALSRHNRAKVSIINARIHRAEAQLHLVAEQLARTKLVAPFDGWIVSGDLTQALGSPVEKGQVLFTVAPLTGYRVIVKIDERDIGLIKEGQKGSLVLSAMPRTSLLFTLENITPVSVIEEGRNYFQAEAKIQDKSDLLRPGMEGVAKISIERRKLLWILTHKIVNWMRLTFWSVLP